MSDRRCEAFASLAVVEAERRRLFRHFRRERAPQQHSASSYLADHEQREREAAPRARRPVGEAAAGLEGTRHIRFAGGPLRTNWTPPSTGRARYKKNSTCH